MDYETIGRQIYPGMKLFIYCNEHEEFSDSIVPDRFRLVLIESGTGILRIGGNRTLFNAPMVLCISEREEVYLEQSVKLKAKSIYFSPSAVNSNLDFINIRDINAEMSQTERNDCTAIKPFFHRTDDFHGLIGIGLTTSKRMLQLFELVKKELEEQRDSYWPCRSRSFFIELLLIVERLFFNPENVSNIVLQENTGYIEKVILYLHSNYENKITLSNLEKTFNINRTTLNERFNEEFGVPVITYLIKLRMRIAAMLLRDTMIPVSEIIERVGFKDLAHFIRSFKKFIGCPPSEYRQQYCWLIK